MTISFDAISLQRPRTGSGSPASLNTEPVKGGSTARSSWTCSPAARSAGLSLITYALSWLLTRWIWPAGDANHHQVKPFYILIMELSTRLGFSGNGYALLGLMGSMGAVGSCYDNSMMESFGSMQESTTLDRRSWALRSELASAMLEWIEAFYNPIRRHSALGYLSPIQHEQVHNNAATAA